MQNGSGWLVLSIAILVSLGLLVFLPVEISVWLLIVLVVVALAGAGIYLVAQGALGHLRQRYAHWREALPQARAADARRVWQPPLRRQLGLECLLVLLAAFWATQHVLLTSDEVRIPGGEIEWLTGHVEAARQAWLEYGDIPLWNPYYRSGEPLIDNAFSYLLNPISSLPVLTLGVTQGIKLAVTLHAMLAALGGWYLAYRLRWSCPTRLLLALLLLGKGNMTHSILMGYYQLGVQQAYFPWIIAGALGTLRERDRTSVALLGVMMALMFMSGNVWYILPMGMSVAALAVVYVRAPASQRAASGGGFLRGFNWRGWWRLGMAAAICLGVSAVYAPAVAANYDHIGNHADEVEAGWVIMSPPAPLLYGLPQLEAAMDAMQVYMPHRQAFGHGLSPVHYSHVIPWWFMLLIFSIVPPLYPYWHRPREAHWQLWLAGGGLIVLMTMWGAGGSDLWKWLYLHIRHLRGWRFVGRALAVGAFWVAVLVALRVEGLWQALRVQRSVRWFFSGHIWQPRRWRHANPMRQRQRMRHIYRRMRQVVIIGALVLAGILATSTATRTWYYTRSSVKYNAPMETCLAGLRARLAQDDIRVWQTGYEIMLPYIRHEIRAADIEAEFLPLPDSSTLGPPWLVLWQELPEFAIATSENDINFLAAQGYEIWLDSPQVDDVLCFWRNPRQAMPYAFTLPPLSLPTVETWQDMRPVAREAAYLRLYDTIAVQAQGTPDGRVLVVKETAYPGWQVWVDGAPAQLDILGGFIAVQLPAAPEHIYRVEFAYRPPLVYAGGVVTIFSVVCLVLYLLRADKIVSKRDFSLKV